MHVEVKLDDFQWARGKYTLSEDKQSLLRDMEQKPAPYRPSMNWLAELVPTAPYPYQAAPFPKGMPAAQNDERGRQTAIRLVHETGFLTVPSDAKYESVQNWLGAFRELLRLYYFVPVRARIHDFQSIPSEWREQFSIGFSDSLKTRDERVLTGKAKQEYELLQARNTVMMENNLRTQKNPLSPETIKRRELELRAASFGESQPLWFQPQIDITGKMPTLVLRPATLQDWYLLQLAGTVAGTLIFPQCKQCGTTMQVDLSDGRSKKKEFCSDSCRAKFDFASGSKTNRRKEKQRLRETSRKTKRK